MLAVLLLVLQAPPAERPLEAAAAAFAKGEAAAREELLKAGPCSILPLRKVREQSPERVDALLYEIKKAAAGFDPKDLLGALEAKRSIDLVDLGFDVAHADLGSELPLLFDPLLFRSHYEKKVTLKFVDRPRREILDSLCRQMGLDYGFFYGTVLIALPGRLWPSGPPPRIAPLSEEETKRATKWIEQLASEGVEEREKAVAALMEVGAGAIPLLEGTALKGDAERAARARDLVARLKRPPPSGDFHAPAAERQVLAGDDKTLLDSLREGQVSYKVADIVVDGALRLLLGPRQIRSQIAAPLKEVRVTLDIQNHSTWAVLALMTHANGFDFLIRDGMLVFDTREEIERRLAAGR